MSFRVVAGYFGEFSDEAKQANQDLGVIGMSFQYQCNLVYSEGAGPNFGFRTDTQAIDVFDALKVGYDGFKVQAGLVKAMGLVDYQLVGGRYELVGHDFRELSLAEINTNLEAMPGLLAQGPMPVRYVTYRRTDDPIDVVGFSGNWALGDSVGFRQLSETLAEPLQAPLAELITAIDQLGLTLQQIDLPTPLNSTSLPPHLSADAHQANVDVWVALTQPQGDEQQALQAIRVAQECNQKLREALTRVYLK
ncbi:hypothetical protein [Lactiplantibacillus paraplantarum]|uniref:Uncharacterized protein n=1 Tax=Lactiplantibacillus paraplantarum TaxID=60520 RepID=A0AAD0TLZ2_9LACO|nr:hypothetical protein [Lactiplantibacillus paraplantarum]AVW09110.1 hypothetical protein DA077_00480 [Lactiplantibacillus paraplantarum]AYJ37377.1 hypothetical protein LP667_00385 [Lactiplantibacillus paraplantarum]ERL45140.1 hypothetical protein N644_0601 [Lactiplantibacillus paraplantarum]MCU4682323.1 hypothetical protein [Lactiplantibacillus paraplantarum]MDL2060915.1 hypothetical protein [Lactiplantibacillus paraplantarum]